MWKCKEWWNIQLTLGIWCRPLSQHPLPPARHQPHCLVCFKKFSVLFIEEHAADCSPKFNLLYNNSADETDDGKIDINKWYYRSLWQRRRGSRECYTRKHDWSRYSYQWFEERTKAFWSTSSINIPWRHAWTDFCSFLSQPWVTAKHKCWIYSKNIGQFVNIQKWLC